MAQPSGPGPSNPSPAPGPGRDTPLDPNSAEGRAAAARLTRTLAYIEVELAERAAIEEAKAA